MARGTDAKLEKKKKRKEARAAEAAKILGDQEMYNEFASVDPDSIVGDGNKSDSEDESDEDVNIGNVEDEKKVSKRIKKGQKKRAAAAAAAAASAEPDCCGGDGIPRPSSQQGIKKTPLILLMLMTGTAVLPALLYMGDWLGAFIQNQHVFGTIGHKLGIGPTPKKRVMSFYEKHDPTKVDEVPNIMSKYYGDYPKLVKKLERKYQDYGYFLNWEQDEAPLKLAKEKLEDTRILVEKQYQKHAPQFVKQRVRNVQYNVGFLLKKGRRVWKKTLWPILEPFIGNPAGGEAQKRKDAQNARARKKGKKNKEYRDDEEF